MSSVANDKSYVLGVCKLDGFGKIERCGGVDCVDYHIPKRAALRDRCKGIARLIRNSSCHDRR